MCCIDDVRCFRDRNWRDYGHSRSIDGSSSIIFFRGRKARWNYSINWIWLEERVNWRNCLAFNFTRFCREAHSFAWRVWCWGECRLFADFFSNFINFSLNLWIRIAKPKNLIPLSPSVQQRAHMRSPEYLALILEPHSRFYEDPLIVLDFQSLYPSVIIAYNYCFSTCLGRVEHLGQ